MRSHKQLSFAYACTFYMVLACALTYPLVIHLSSAVAHDVGDPLLSTTLLWWNAHTLPLTDRWWDGFAFYPARGMLTFSDHRLGESLLATPLQWLGAGPVTAYNLTWLAMFPLSALAAHWLAFVLTRRHDSALIAGLAFGFCPYRIAHLPHLELLAAFGMPAALAALHRYTDTRRRHWLTVFAVSLVLQGLCSSYYTVFFSILLGLWLLWFIRPGDMPTLLGILTAGACALLALMPVAIGYLRFHAHYGFARPFYEILQLSADATSYFTAHSTLRLWGWTSRWAKSEGELFPGATIALLAIAGAIGAWRRSKARDSIDRRARWLLPLAVISAAVAFCGWAYSPWRIAFPGGRISSDAPFKPMTVTLLVMAIWISASSPLRHAYARRSPCAFYGLATIVLALCSLGPKPTFAGQQFLYEPPYAWLMRLPIFESIRAPARLGLLVVLTLAVTGALAFNRLRVRETTRRTLASLCVIGVIADGWISPLALPSMPATWAPSRAKGFAAVLELPMGEVFDDIAAMYRAISHGRPTVNGSSGFEPRYYSTLRTGFDERDPAVLGGFPPRERLLLVIDKHKDPQHGWQRFLASVPQVTLVADEPHWTFFGAETQPEAPVCNGQTVPILGISTNDPPADLRALTDQNSQTWWTTTHFQRAGDELILDLGAQLYPCAVALSSGQAYKSYPRRLVVETSTDGQAWNGVADERTVGLAIRGALRDPKTATILIPLKPSAGRFVRLQVAETHPSVAWQVADIEVRTAADTN